MSRYNNFPIWHIFYRLLSSLIVIRTISGGSIKLFFLNGISLSCWSMAGRVSYNDGLWNIIPSVPPMQDKVNTHRRKRSNTIETNFQSSTIYKMAWEKWRVKTINISHIQYYTGKVWICLCCNLNLKFT